MTVAPAGGRPPIAPLKRAFTLRYHRPRSSTASSRPRSTSSRPSASSSPRREALDILAEHGCRVDRERQVVYFAPELVLVGHGDGAAPLRPRRPRPVV